MSSESASTAASSEHDPFFAHSIFVSVVCGVMGVLSGFAVFLLWNRQADHHHGWLFFGVLIFAAIIAFITEWVRDLIRHGHPEELSLSRVMAVLVTLMMFELIIIAWETLPEHLDAWKDVPRTLLGPAIASAGRPWTNLFALIGVWVIAGVALAVALAILISGLKQGFDRRGTALEGAKRGLLAGLIAAPVGTLLFVIVVRVLLALHLFIFEHEKWSQMLKELASIESSHLLARIFAVTFRFFSWIDSLFTMGWWGPVVGLVVLIGLFSFVVQTRLNWVSALLCIAAFIAIFGPVFVDLGTLVMIPILAALVWSVPGVILGLAAPMLDRPSSLPREWGMIALLAAGVLGVVTWSRFEYWWLFPTLLMLVAAIFFYRGVKIEDYWPIVALSVAIIVAGLTWVAQVATFSGVFERVHRVNSLPAYTPAPKRVITEEQFRDWLRRRDGSDPFDQLARISTTRFSFSGNSPTASELMKRTDTLRDFTSSVRLSGSLSTAAATAPSFTPSTHPLLRRLEDIRRAEQGSSPATIPAAPSSGNSSPARTAVTLPSSTQPSTQPAAPYDLSHYVSSDPHDSSGDMDAARQVAARRLEISITGSLAFWLTVGFLAVWSMKRTRDHGRTESPV